MFYMPLGSFFPTYSAIHTVFLAPFPIMCRRRAVSTNNDALVNHVI